MRPNDPVPHRGPLTSCGPTVITAAFISGGGSLSSAHWVKPRYDNPTVPNVPVNQLCSRSHATVSAPSGTSCTMGENSPPEPNVPRTLCTTT